MELRSLSVQILVCQYVQLLQILQEVSLLHMILLFLQLEMVLGTSIHTSMIKTLQTCLVVQFQAAQLWLVGVLLQTQVGISQWKLLLIYLQYLLTGQLTLAILRQFASSALMEFRQSIMMEFWSHLHQIHVSQLFKLKQLLAILLLTQPHLLPLLETQTPTSLTQCPHLVK